MKLQGEYVVRLRELEDSLLEALNNVQGSILEDEQVIKTLEKLKQEAAHVTQEMRQSESIMGEVLAVTQQYVPLAASTSRVFFAILTLSNVHYLYQFSLQFFMDTVYHVINKNEQLQKVPKGELDRRRLIIFNEFFREVYRRINVSLLSEDKLIFAVKLAEVKLGDGVQAKHFATLFRPPRAMQTSLSANFLRGKLTLSQLKSVEALGQEDQFCRLVDHMERNEDVWLDFMNADAPEEDVPRNWENRMIEPPSDRVAWLAESAQFNSEFFVLLAQLRLLLALRPDRFQFVLRRLATLVLGELDEGQVDMRAAIEREVTARTPVLLCSAPGFDPSFKVE